MKVLALVHKYPPVHNAGAELMLSTILEDLVARGHNATVAYPGARAGDWRGVTVVDWASGRRDTVELARRHDVVLTHLDRTRHAVTAARRAGRPVVHLLHNDRQLRFHNVEPDDADLLVANSRWIADTVEHAAPLIVVRPPVRAGDYAVDDPPPATRERITLLNLTAAKGAPLLYRLAELEPDRLFLGVRGAYGHQLPPPRLPNLDVIANTSNVVDDVYARTRVLLVPSSYESWGRVAIEACAAGIPVIAHPTLGLRESLGDAGIFLDRDDVDAWRRALDELDDPDTYAAASARAICRAAELDPTEDLDLLAAELDRLAAPTRLRVDLRVSTLPYLEHLAPIAAELDKAGALGDVYVTPWLEADAIELGLPAKVTADDRDLPRSTRPTLVASYRDLCHAGRRPVVFAQHGAGQSYSSRHPSYPGGRGHDPVALFLMPNNAAAQRSRRRYPRVPHAVIGCPKLDAWHAVPPKPIGDRPVVALSFHWRCQVAPEAGTAWDSIGPAVLDELVAMRDVGELDLLGHGHPAILEELRPHYAAAGVEVVARFAEVLERADVYVVDNSSTLFEFASTGRPVVVVNAPHWRRHVAHGLRFWNAATIGPNIDTPAEVSHAIHRALERRPGDERLREAGVTAAYSHTDGNAARRAAMVIINTFETGSRCAICGAAACRCGGDTTTRGVEILRAVKSPGPPRIYRFAPRVAPGMSAGGDLRLKLHDARRLGVEPDGPTLPRPVRDRLVRIGVKADIIDELAERYAEADDDARRRVLTELAATPNGKVLDELSAVNLPAARPTPDDDPDADTDTGPLDEQVPDGRVGDVLDWVNAEADDDDRRRRARTARDVERDGRRRASLLVELDRIAGDDNVED